MDKVVLESSESSSSIEEEISSGPEYAVELSIGQWITFDDPITGTGNKWAVRLSIASLASYDTSDPDWGVILGSDAWAGFVGMHRLSRIFYRDINYGSSYHNAGSEADVLAYEDYNFQDLWVISDGTDIIIETTEGTYTLSGVAEAAQFTVGGGGVPAAGTDAHIKIKTIQAWDLTNYSGTLSSEDIMEEPPTHEYLLNEGSGTIVEDNAGSNDGEINLESSSDTVTWEEL